MGDMGNYTLNGLSKILLLHFTLEERPFAAAYALSQSPAFLSIQSNKAREYAETKKRHTSAYRSEARPLLSKLQTKCRSEKISDRGKCLPEAGLVLREHRYIGHVSDIARKAQLVFDEMV